MPEETGEPQGLEGSIIAALRTVFDPEIPLNVYDLGLIYDLTVDEELGSAHIRMTLTSPACPVAGSLPGEVERRVAEVEGVETATVELVWDPPWDKDRLSDEAKLQLGML